MSVAAAAVGAAGPAEASAVALASDDAPGVSDASLVLVELDSGQRVVAEVHHSARVRVTRIQLGVDRPLRVIVPDGASDEFAAEALRAKGDWVARKLRVVQQAQARAQRGRLGLDRADFVWDAGKPLRIQEAAVPFARRRDDLLEVPADDAVPAVARWYRRRARAYLRALVSDEGARLGLAPTRVVVRDQRTRWGSCSARGELSLNWRLLLVPEEIARYVVIHELVHLRVPNHTKAFWRELANALPDWQRSADWLAEHAEEVRRVRLG